MDGTLLRRTSAPVLLAAARGQDEALVELEERFAAGTATAVQFGRALHEMWGVVPAEIARRAFTAAPDPGRRGVRRLAVLCFPV